MQCICARIMKKPNVQGYAKWQGNKQNIPYGSCDKWCKIGSANAAVLPEPVLARAITSFPFIMDGMPFAWICVAWVIPIWWQLSTSHCSKPSSYCLSQPNKPHICFDKQKKKQYDQQDDTYRELRLWKHSLIRHVFFRLLHYWLNFYNMFTFFWKVSNHGYSPKTVSNVSVTHSVMH